MLKLINTKRFLILVFAFSAIISCKKDDDTEKVEKTIRNCDKKGQPSVSTFGTWEKREGNTITTLIVDECGTLECNGIKANDSIYFVDSKSNDGWIDIGKEHVLDNKVIFYDVQGDNKLIVRDNGNNILNTYKKADDFGSCKEGIPTSQSRTYGIWFYSFYNTFNYTDDDGYVIYDSSQVKEYIQVLPSGFIEACYSSGEFITYSCELNNSRDYLCKFNDRDSDYFFTFKLNPQGGKLVINFITSDGYSGEVVFEKSELTELPCKYEPAQTNRSLRKYKQERLGLLN